MGMRKPLWVALLVLAVWPAEVHAQGSGAGIGIIVGEPTGLSMKFWQSRSTAIDLAAAWSFSDDGAFHVHADYLWHNFNLFKVSKGRLPLYYGIGVRVKVYDDNRDDDVIVGLRIPVGLDYLFGGGTPLDIFFEVVPILDLNPDTEFSLNASIGMRYWF
jgi:hypothetical protein